MELARELAEDPFWLQIRSWQSRGTELAKEGISQCIEELVKELIEFPSFLASQPPPYSKEGSRSWPRRGTEVAGAGRGEVRSWPSF